MSALVFGSETGASGISPTSTPSFFSSCSFLGLLGKHAFLFGDAAIERDRLVFIGFRRLPGRAQLIIQSVFALLHFRAEKLLDVLYIQPSLLVFQLTNDAAIRGRQHCNR